VPRSVCGKAQKLADVNINKRKKYSDSEPYSEPHQKLWTNWELNPGPPADRSHGCDAKRA
jgi:hypothetical protein